MSRWIHDTQQRVRRNQSGFSLVELIIVLLVLAILASIAYVAYAALIREAATKALQTTAFSIDREASSLAAFEPGTTTADEVEAVLTGGNGFTADGGTWTTDTGITITPTSEGGYILT